MAFYLYCDCYFTFQIMNLPVTGVDSITHFKWKPNFPPQEQKIWKCLTCIGVVDSSSKFLKLRQSRLLPLTYKWVLCVITHMDCICTASSPHSSSIPMLTEKLACLSGHYNVPLRGILQECVTGSCKVYQPWAQYDQWWHEHCMDQDNSKNNSKNNNK